MFRVASALCFGALVVAWLIVAARTARGSARGWLFLPAAQLIAANPSAPVQGAGGLPLTSVAGSR